MEKKKVTGFMGRELKKNRRKNNIRRAPYCVPGEE